MNAQKYLNKSMRPVKAANTRPQTISILKEVCGEAERPSVCRRIGRWLGAIFLRPDFTEREWRRLEFRNEFESDRRPRHVDFYRWN